WARELRESRRLPRAVQGTRPLVGLETIRLGSGVGVSMPRAALQLTQTQTFGGLNRLAEMAWGTRQNTRTESIPVIEVEHLTKRYGHVVAVDDISFQVKKGEILGFLGPHGAGKTTTGRVLTGYIPPTEGRAVVAGYDVFERPIEAKRRTGYLPETPPLYPDMTVREYLHFVAKIKGVAPRERTARVEQVMSRAWVTDMAGRACGKLSKGYRERVGLAQALIHNPDVLILDEPTAGPDPKHIIDTRP